MIDWKYIMHTSINLIKNVKQSILKGSRKINGSNQMIRRVFTADVSTHTLQKNHKQKKGETSKKTSRMFLAIFLSSWLSLLTASSKGILSWTNRTEKASKFPFGLQETPKKFPLHERANKTCLTRIKMFFSFW